MEVFSLKSHTCRTRLHLVTFVTLSTVILAACSVVENTAWKSYSDAERGYSFQYPSEWSVEYVPELNGILVMCPDIEVDWQANIFFEIRRDDENRSPNEALEDLLPNVKAHKRDFRLIGRGVARAPTGLEKAWLEYTHVFDGTVLSETETLVFLESDKVLFATRSTALQVDAKYQPTLKRIVDSIAKL